jgi:hypothetical protein
MCNGKGDDSGQQRRRATGEVLSMNAMKVVAAVIAVALAMYLTQQHSNGSGKPGPKQAGGPATSPAATRQTAPDALVPLRGMAIQVNSDYKPMEQFGKLIDEIADLGANSILISTAGYQENSNSGEIFIDSRKSPSQEQWDQLLNYAHRKGLRVVLMPIVLLTHPRTSTEWRGVIEPPRWDEWWASYTDYILYYAKIASRHPDTVEVFIIGSELISTEDQGDQWDKLIADVRSIYHGKLSYSSNWDHYERVPLWGKLDLVCMTTYHKLSDTINPPLEELVEAWKPVKKDILAWQAKTDKPILFTEVGWPSQEGCSIEPWNYYRQDVATKTGLAEQANCYRSFIKAWDDEIKQATRVAGVLWWEWTPYGGGPTCNNYTPKGKPAEKVLRDWFKANGTPVVRQAQAPASQTSAERP